MIYEAWDRVSQNTATNCFARAGFRFKANDTIPDFPEEDLSLIKYLHLQEISFEISTFYTIDSHTTCEKVDYKLELAKLHELETEDNQRKKKF